MSKHIFLAFIISVALVACDKKSDESKVAAVEKVVPVLTDENINDFTVKMAKDYIAKLDSLLVAFNQAKKDDEVYQFVNFRNSQWTPAYIKQKDYYQKVWTENSAYLLTSPNKPLFDSFEYLIYTGINLKNGLLDNDDIKLQAQLVEIQKDKDIVNSFIK